MIKSHIYIFSALFFLTTTLTGQSVSELPLFQMEDMNYEGAFRVDASTYNESNINYSEGPIAYNPDNHSLFIVGHAHQQAIAEFAIPNIVNSTNLEDLEFAINPMQGFYSVLDRTPNGNPESIDRVGGLYYVKNGEETSLIVNGYEYYDAPGNNTVSTLIVDNPDALANSSVRGFYAYEGGAGHTSGWISPIPTSMHTELGGTHITGQSSGIPIISRTTVGPSAFAFDIDDLLQTTGSIATTKLLDFSLGDPLHEDLSNDALDNDIWTHLSRVTYGFIVPGTRTYMTVGKSGGHQSGVCYKCEQDNGNLCGGYCSYIAADNYNHYWLWDLNDLLQVKAGTMASHDVRPYDYGIFDTPFQSYYTGIGGGSFDPATGNLYLTLQKADTAQGFYSRPPVVVVYKVSAIVSNIESSINATIYAYPNPASDYVTFSNVSAGSSITLMDALGRVVLVFKASTIDFTLPTQFLSSGVYYVVVKDDVSGHRQVVRIVKR